jgi:hypothetical protein
LTISDSEVSMLKEESSVQTLEKSVSSQVCKVGTKYVDQLSVA